MRAARACPRPGPFCPGNARLASRRPRERYPRRYGFFSFSPYEQQAIGRARRSDIDGRPVRFALPEDLVIHKLVAGRPRDHEDVKTVLAKNPVLDLAYIRAWLRQFEAVVDQKLNDVFEGILASLNDG